MSENEVHNNFLIENGSFQDVSFMRLLWSLFKTKSTGFLTLKRGDIEKEIVFKDGLPIFAKSNLLHETLAKYLVQEGILSNEQSEEAFQRTLITGNRIGESLLEMGVLDSTTLYAMIRRNIALKILECFLWWEGSYSFSRQTQMPDQVIQMPLYTGRLIIQGVDHGYTLDRIEKEGFEWSGQYFHFVVSTKEILDQLGLTGQDLRLVRMLDEGKTSDEIIQQLKISTEMVVRRLYILWGLGFMKFGKRTEQEEILKFSKKTEAHKIVLDDKVFEGVQESPAMEKEVESKSDQDDSWQSLIDEVLCDFHRLMSLDYFSLLQVHEHADPLEITDGFLRFCSKYAPNRFDDSKFDICRPRAREMFLRGVNAYCVLSQKETRKSYLESLRQTTADKTTKRTNQPGAAFKIQTILLDAQAQFKKGLTLLDSHQYDQASHVFAYALSLDSNQALYMAYLGWTLHLSNASQNYEKAKDLLIHSCELSPKDPVVLFLSGKFFTQVKELETALKFFQRAHDLAPDHKDISVELSRVQRSIKAEKG